MSIKAIKILMMDFIVDSTGDETIDDCFVGKKKTCELRAWNEFWLFSRFCNCYKVKKKALNDLSSMSIFSSNTI